VRTNKERWIAEQREDGWRIVAVELAENSIALPRLEPAARRTIVLLGHEWHGIPDEQIEAADLCVEIPMIGQPGLKAERPEVLWDSLTGLLLSSTSARLRATAYSALAYVPDTTVLGSKTDQLGRSGIAISFTHDSTGTTQTLIVSPATGDLLELDRTQKRDADGMRAGTVIQRELFLRRAIVAAAVALPGGGYQPLDPTSQG
jgi:hypothetical protein